MKMTNREMVENHNKLDEFQLKENEYYKTHGEKLLKGRVKISYAIEKNKSELRRQLEPYNKTLEKLISEYRDTDAEQAAIKEEQEESRKEGRNPRNVSIIMKDGKTKDEYIDKFNELQDLEVEVDNIRMVDISEFDGLDLDSSDLRPFIFMIKD